VSLFSTNEGTSEASRQSADRCDIDLKFHCSRSFVSSHYKRHFPLYKVALFNSTIAWQGLRTAAI
jgi:hypothetical protein